MIQPPDFNNWLNFSPFQFDSVQKEIQIRDALLALTRFHFGVCKEYRQIIELLGADLENIKSVEEIPYIPVRLLKNLVFVAFLLMKSLRQ